MVGHLGSSSKERSMPGEIINNKKGEGNDIERYRSKYTTGN
jgi:hypothetical protein